MRAWQTRELRAESSPTGAVELKPGRLILNCLGFAFLFVLILVSSCPAGSVREWKKLYAEKQYFDLRESLLADSDTTTLERTFFEGAIDNRFNNLRGAVRQLSFFVAHSKANDPAYLADAHTLLASSYLRLGQYGKAAHELRILLSSHSRTLTSDEMRTTANSMKLYRALEEVPPEEVVLGGPTTVEPLRDKFGGNNLPVIVAGRTIPFIFDTGANFSVLRASLAKSLKVRILETRVTVKNFSGSNTQVQIGIAPSIRLGGAIIRNVVFLIFDDKDLTFPDGFQIQGILGFPVIEALGRVTVFKDGSIRIGVKSSMEGEPNLCLEDRNLLSVAVYRGQRLVFEIDSGADRTLFYPKFFQTFRKEIIRSSVPIMEKLVGAGGQREIPARRIDQIRLAVAGKVVTLRNVDVLTKPSSLEASRYFYANLGRDALNQFASITYDFRSMTLQLEL